MNWLERSLHLINFYWTELTAGVLTARVFIIMTILMFIGLTIALIIYGRRINKHFDKIEKRWDKEGK